MRKLMFYPSALACILLSMAWASAQETGKTGPWSLDNCIKAAMGNQTDVLSAQNNITIARSRTARARSEYFPQLSLQTNAFRVGSQTGVLNQTSTGTALNVNQNVFDGGLREVSALGARYGIRQSQAGLSRTVQTVVFNVTRAYYEVLRARHLAEVAQKNVEYNEGLRKQIEAQAEEGKSAKVDVLPVEAQLANARVSLLSAQNAVRRAALDLQIAMGVALQPGFDVQEVEGLPNAEIASTDLYLASALKSRPDIAESQAGLGAARATTRVARLNMYPRPVISGNYQRQVSGGFTNSSTQMIGSIVFDIFNGSANRAALNEARASQSNAELQDRQLLKDISAQVEEARLNLTSAKERTSASAVGLDAAEKNYEAQKERYRLGSGTTLDLLNAEVQVITAESNNVQARYDYYIAMAQVDYSTGSAVPQHAPGGNR